MPCSRPEPCRQLAHLLRGSLPVLKRKFDAFVFNSNAFDDLKPQLDRGDPVLDEEFQRLKTEVSPRRVVHNLQEVGDLALLGILLLAALSVLIFLMLKIFIGIFLPRDNQ